MSDMEYHTGRMRKIDLNGESIEEWAKRICEENDWEDNYNEGWIDVVRDYGWNEYAITKDEVWELVEHSQFDPDNIFEAVLMKDGSITFNMAFYNGGTCLPEMLEEAIKKAK